MRYVVWFANLKLGAFEQKVITESHAVAKHACAELQARDPAGNYIVGHHDAPPPPDLRLNVIVDPETSNALARALRA